MRIFIVLFISMCSISAFSQIEKGSWLIDFNGKTGYDYEINFSFPQLYLSLAYLPTNNLAVGINYGGKAYFPEGRNRGTSLYAAFARYYLNPSSENFHFFGQLKLGALSDYLQDETTEYRWFFTPSAGMSYELNAGLGFEVGLGLTFMESLNTGQMRYNNLNFTLGWMATISERSKLALEESEYLFGRGSITLSAGFTLNNSFDLGLSSLLASTEAELLPDALVFSNLNESSSNVGTIDFGIGFFLGDRTVFNIGLGIINFSETRIDPATTIFAIAPGLRYYIPLKSKRTLIFGQATYEFGGVNLGGLGAESTYHFISAGAGVNYLIGPSVALEIGADFGRLSWDIINEEPYLFNVFYGLRLFL